MQKVQYSFECLQHLGDTNLNELCPWKECHLEECCNHFLCLKMMVICSGQTNKKPSDVRGKAVSLPSRHENNIPRYIRLVPSGTYWHEMAAETGHWWALICPVSFPWTHMLPLCIDRNSNGLSFNLELCLVTSIRVPLSLLFRGRVIYRRPLLKKWESSLQEIPYEYFST